MPRADLQRASRPKTGPDIGGTGFGEVRKEISRPPAEIRNDIALNRAVPPDIFDRRPDDHQAVCPLQSVNVLASNNSAAGLFRLMVADQVAFDGLRNRNGWNPRQVDAAAPCARCYHDCVEAGTSRLRLYLSRSPSTCTELT